MRYLCVHNHFYQPPRENPWLEAIELQDSAYPYHDWNERIMAECYAPNTAARLLDANNRIQKIVNNYANTSFNVGPTLLSWMKEKAPEAYHAILDADRISADRFSGHGSAIAQCYNHMIMPLANERDKLTQVRWGIRDFQHRFGRMPEGMWLPETAVDLKTLDMMAEAGIKFTVLAPSQASTMDGEDVSGAKIDPTRPYLLKLPSGRSISVFFYDGPISRAVAFERLLNNGEQFAKRLLDGFSEDRDWKQLVHIATDGETYGHHHPFGEMALAYALEYIESNELAKITNYGEFLEANPPEHEVEIIEKTSWSCVHGVDRWSTNCGCNSGGHSDWNQEWRSTLRAALDWLRDRVGKYFEEGGRKYLKKPWDARNDYIDVILDRSPESRERFAAKHFKKRLSQANEVIAWRLLEMQRHAMLMYTSCGWFFDELSGIETVQVIEYAGRVVQIADELFGDAIELDFLNRLAQAKSNLPEHKDGAVIYEKFVKPGILDLEKLGAHYAISSLFEQYEEHTGIYCYSADRLDYTVKEAGNMRVAIGRARFTSEITQDAEQLSFAVLHFGDHNVHAGVHPHAGESAYKGLVKGVLESFANADIAGVIRIMDQNFGAQTYSLKDLLKDEQRKVTAEILKPILQEDESAYRRLHDAHAPTLRFLHANYIPVPKEMAAAAEYAINGRLRHALEQDELDFDRIRDLLDEIRIAGVKLDETTLEFTLRKNLERKSDKLFANPLDIEELERFAQVMANAKPLPLPLSLWSIQNQCYEVLQTRFPAMRERAIAGDEEARTWTAQFAQLAELVSLLVPAAA
jgi:alpha-amylase/alpha-mannosidase (GH57 family)